MVAVTRAVPVGAEINSVGSSGLSMREYIPPPLSVIKCLLNRIHALSPFRACAQLHRFLFLNHYGRSELRADDFSKVPPR